MTVTEQSARTLFHYAYYDADGIVVNVIIGNFAPDEERLFFEQHRDSLGAVGFARVTPQTPVWIGGLYADGVFTPAPEPQPEPLPEPQPEPEI